MERENNRFQAHAMRLRRRGPTRAAPRAPGEAGDPAPLRPRPLSARPRLSAPAPPGRASPREPTRLVAGGLAPNSHAASAGARRCRDDTERRRPAAGSGAAGRSGRTRVRGAPRPPAAVRRVTAPRPPEERPTPTAPPPPRARFWGCRRRVRSVRREAAPPTRRAAVAVAARPGAPRAELRPTPSEPSGATLGAARASRHFPRRLRAGEPHAKAPDKSPAAETPPGRGAARPERSGPFSLRAEPSRGEPCGGSAAAGGSAGRGVGSGPGRGEGERGFQGTPARGSGTDLSPSARCDRRSSGREEAPSEAIYLPPESGLRFPHRPRVTMAALGGF